MGRGGRIGPACAGKRSCPYAVSCNARDHPRMCGEKGRGGRGGRGSWDHPRMCGEKTASECRLKPAPGSPPHVRGKDAKTARAVTRAGITPACAGKRLASPARCLALRDHPRMCGEKGFSAWAPHTSPGSPPHVRGKAQPG